MRRVTLIAVTFDLKPLRKPGGFRSSGKRVATMGLTPGHRAQGNVCWEIGLVASRAQGTLENIYLYVFLSHPYSKSVLCVFSDMYDRVV